MKLNLKTPFLLGITFFSSFLFSQIKPQSKPNNNKFSPIHWKIVDYENFIKNETALCSEQSIRNLHILNIIRLQKQVVANYDESIKKSYNDSINTAIKDSIAIRAKLSKECEQNLQKKIEYANEWISYLTEVEKQIQIQEVADKQAKIDNEIRIAKENKEFKEQQELRKKTDDDNYAAIGKSIECKNWKIKYLGIIKSADANKLIIINIEKKYSFRNIFGNRVWNAADVSKKDKLIYNKNYDIIKIKYDAAHKLEVENERFLNYYQNSTIDDNTGKGYEEHFLYEFYYQRNWLN